MPTALRHCRLDGRKCIFFFFHTVLRRSVAVSTMCHQSSRIAAFLQADARPLFRWPRSAATARSQMWLGLPNGCCQSGGSFRITAAIAQRDLEGITVLSPPEGHRAYVNNMSVGVCGVLTRVLHISEFSLAAVKSRAICRFGSGFVAFPGCSGTLAIKQRCVCVCALRLES